MSYADYEWYLKQDLSMYSGQWLIIKDQKIIAKGKDAGKLLEAFWKKYPKRTPFITRVNTKLSIRTAA